jgi:flagellar biosynthesis/type III secretory pathway M-ring protein FliF/YscJ
VTVAAAAAAAAVLLFVVAGLGLRKPKTAPRGTPVPAIPSPASPAHTEVVSAPHPAVELAGPPVENRMESKLAQHEAKQKQLEEEALQSLQLTPAITKTAEVLTKHIREKVAKAPDISAQILRTWIHEEDVKI